MRLVGQIKKLRVQAKPQKMVKYKGTPRRKKKKKTVDKSNNIIRRNK